MNNFKQVSGILAQRAEDVARYLLPQGKREGQEWCVGSIDGGSGKSLKLHLTGEKSGIWCDFATGDSGDLIDLWALNRNISPMAALKEAQQYLGVGQPIFYGHQQKNFARPSIKIVMPVARQSPVMSYLVNQRKLTVETIQAFGVGEQGKKIIFYYLRDKELIFLKSFALDRIDGKKQIYVEKNCEPCLFGWQALPVNTRKVTLTEGELDCMSLYQYGFPSLSVPFGGGEGIRKMARI